MSQLFEPYRLGDLSLPQITSEPGAAAGFKTAPGRMQGEAATATRQIAETAMA